MSEQFDIEALPVAIRYAGETTRDDNWQCDQWSVTISWRNDRGTGQFTTDYFTGLGLRRKAKRSWAKDAQPVKPKVADVLYSMFMDASAAEYNFDDWCDCYGYSNDSIKALNIYKQCMNTAAMLRKAFDKATLEQIETIIQEM